MTNCRLKISAGIIALAAGAIVFLTAAAPGKGAKLELEEANIFWEYNSTDNDLGVHVFLDGEDWKKMTITNPLGHRLFDVKGQGLYKKLGMSELFFEGAEPVLGEELELEELLAGFPEGEYEFEGKTAGGDTIEGEDDFTHAIPAGPKVVLEMSGSDFLRISWSEVTAPPPGFPDRPIEIVAYQVLVDEVFDVIVPSSVLSVTVTPELVAALENGEHEFEVLAIEESGNQSITESSFMK